MCREGKPDRAVTLYEGHIRCIMELDTPEEKIAALETVFAIAFPEDEDRPYEPPEIPKDGSRLSAVDKARRMAYNIFSGLIKYHGTKFDSRVKDYRKVEAGRIGALARWGDSTASTASRTESAAADFTASQDKDTASSASADGKSTKPKSQVPQDVLEDDFSGYEAGRYRFQRQLTKEEKEAIAEWDRKIPNADALLEFIKKNFMHATRAIAIKPEFCTYAYHKLARVDRWISTKTRRPLRDIRAAIHYIALDYKRQIGEVKRADEEERRKNLESEFNLKKTELSQMSNTDLADLERRRRRQAEKEAAEKIMKGEL